MVVAWAPLPEDLSKKTPVKVIGATVDAGYMHSGVGSTRLQLSNVRANYTFTLVRGGFSAPVAVAVSQPVAFARPNEPTQVHVLVTPRSGELRVQWVTADGTGQAVEYGTSPGSLPLRTPATQATYAASDLCGAPATTVGWHDPGVQNSVILSGLAPGSKVYYRVGGAAGGWSAVMNATVPLGADKSQSVVVGVFGDMGTAEADGSVDVFKIGQSASLNTTHWLRGQLPGMSAVLHIGDISYARGYGVHWDEFYNQVQPIASRVPWQQGIGNHERDFPNSGSTEGGSDSGGECGVPYATRFTNPRTESSADEPWYSFQHGPVHFTVMSTEHAFANGSAQLTWLEKDLASVDRAVTPWIVFGGHRPMYIDSTYENDLEVADRLRASVEPLLNTHGVDLALWGHHHSYQRSCPVFDGVCQQPGHGTVHAVVGMAGYGLSTDIRKTAPGWAEHVNCVDHGYGMLHADADSLTLRFHRNTDNAVRDSVTLTAASAARW